MNKLTDEIEQTRKRNLQLIVSQCDGEYEGDRLYLNFQREKTEYVRTCVMNLICGLPIDRSVTDESKDKDKIGCMNISFLHIATLFGDEELCVNICNANTRFNNTKWNIFGCNPLHLACVLGNNNLIKLYLEKGAKIEKKIVSNQATALHLAARFNQTKVVETLLTHNAIVDSRDVSNHTPLHYVCAKSEVNIELRDLLLKAGADPFAKNNGGKTPADWDQTIYLNPENTIQHKVLTLMK